MTAGDDREVIRRALLFDLRNLGTLGLQQDSFPGLLWADAIYGHATLSPERHAGDPGDVRRDVGAGRARGRLRTAARRLGGDRARARALQRSHGRHDREPPDPEDRPARLRRRQARGADPGADRSDQAARREAGRPLRRLPRGRAAREQGAARVEPAAARPLLALPRRAHPRRRMEGDPRGVDRSRAARRSRRSRIGGKAIDEVAFCEGCHSQHRDFGPLVFSSSRLFPFDADGDGDAQLNPDADRRAGGIGTDPWLAFDVPRSAVAVRDRRPDHLRSGARRARRSAHIGAAWVRAAPLVGLAASAPYLHNGSVPSLRALLDPPAKRPKTFPLGKRRLRLRHPPPRQRQPGPRVRHRAHLRRKSRPDRFSGDSLSGAELFSSSGASGPSARSPRSRCPPCRPR